MISALIQSEDQTAMKMQRILKEISLCAMKTALPRRRNCHMAYMW